MGFWSLLEVASMPILQFLLIGLVGAFLASGYSNILSPDARRETNKVVFYVFTPALIFASLAKAVTFHDIISWWFMPVNIGITFLIGSILGWLAVKIVKPERHLEGLVIANCSAGNLGNLLLIIVPAVCDEDASPFGDSGACNARALSYVSLSMAIGGIYIWTHSYSLMKKVGRRDDDEPSKPTLMGDDEEALSRQSSSLVDEPQQSGQIAVPLLSSGKLRGNKMGFWSKFKGALHQLAEELMAPPTVAAGLGFVVGVIPWVKSVIIGANAPLRVVYDSLMLLGDGTMPCITLILGGNLTRGLGKSVVKYPTILAIIVVRYMLLPAAGIGVVKAAGWLGFLPKDPLYSYVLLLQFALPPAMAIGTMAQLFDIGQEECSVIFLWTYLAAALALTVWSTVFMYILA